MAVEFTDYQCPFCQRMEMVKQRVGMPNVRIAIRHLPLEQIHPNASLAAKISICTELLEPTVWSDIHRLLYRVADSLQAINWLTYLEDAGVQNASEIETCIKSDMTTERLAEDRQYAAMYRIVGTPSYVFSNHIQRGAVDGDTWKELLALATARLSPVGEGEVR